LISTGAGLPSPAWTSRSSGKSPGLYEAKKRLTQEKLYLEEEINTELGFEETIGESKALQAVMENVGKVASSDATVLRWAKRELGRNWWPGRSTA
jgi:hypothetical protein